MASLSPRKTLTNSPSSSGRPPQAVKVSRRTSSGRFVSLSRDDDLDMSGDYSGQTDYINYTVLMPPTPDNQPGGGTGSDSKSDGTATTRFGSEARGLIRRVGDSDPNGGGGDGDAAKDRRMSVMKSSNNKSMLLRSQTSDFDHNRWLFETKGRYGIGNAYWQDGEQDQGYVSEGMSMADFMDNPWRPLTRKVKVPPAILSPYRYQIITMLHSLPISITLPLHTISINEWEVVRGLHRSQERFYDVFYSRGGLLGGSSVYFIRRDESPLINGRLFEGSIDFRRGSMMYFIEVEEKIMRIHLHGY